MKIRHGDVALDGGDVLLACAQEDVQLRHILQQIGHADGRDEQGDTGGFAQRLVGHFFDQHAQQGTADNGQQHGDVGVDNDHGCPEYVRTYHNNVAVGKIQKRNNAVNHAVADGYQRIHGTGLQAVDNLPENHEFGSCLSAPGRRPETG